MDGLTGEPVAIETLYPHTRVQLCMVHLVRNSLKYVSYTHRKEVAADLKLIYRQPLKVKRGSIWSSLPKNGIGCIQALARCGEGIGVT